MVVVVARETGRLTIRLTIRFTLRVLVAGGGAPFRDNVGVGGGTKEFVVVVTLEEAFSSVSVLVLGSAAEDDSDTGHPISETFFFLKTLIFRFTTRFLVVVGTGTAGDVASTVASVSFILIVKSSLGSLSKVVQADNAFFRSTSGLHRVARAFDAGSGSVFDS